MVTGIITAILILFVIVAYYFLLRYQSTKLIEKFTTWLLFSVVLALTPLIFSGLLIFISGSNPTSSGLLFRGELFIVSVAIGADAAGKLIGSNKEQKTRKIFAAGSNFLLVIISSLLFASIAGTNGSATFDKERISLLSHLLFLLTMIASGSCVLIAEAEAE